MQLTLRTQDAFHFSFENLQSQVQRGGEVEWVGNACNVVVVVVMVWSLEQDPCVQGYAKEIVSTTENV